MPAQPPHAQRNDRRETYALPEECYHQQCDTGAASRADRRSAEDGCGCEVEEEYFSWTDVVHNGWGEVGSVR